MSEREYILGDPVVDGHHLIMYRNVHSIFPSSCPHALLPSVHRSVQLVWFLTHCYHAALNTTANCTSLQAPLYAPKFTPDCTGQPA